ALRRRQTLGGETFECRSAQGPEPADAGSRQVALLGLVMRDEALADVGLARHLDLRARALTPPRRIRHSPWPRARAPAPCRPNARCGRGQARAPGPARCGTRGAGNA